MFNKNDKKNNEENWRFKLIYQQGDIVKGPYNQIIVDTETGVNYLLNNFGGGGSITPLLGKDAKPVITPV